MKIANRQPVATADASSNRGQMWREFRKLILYAALLVVAVYFSIGWIVDLSVPFISPQREAALFSSWQPGRETSSEDTARLHPAQDILERLIQDPAVPRLPYRLILFEHDAPNAFAFPGGTIGITKELLDTVDHQTALAFVLGHELGHFRNRDHLRGLGRNIGGSIAFALIFGGDMGNTQFADTFNYVLGRSYSRAQEEAADLFGIGLVYRHFGKTEGCDQLFRILREDMDMPEWAYMLSTHPSPGDRIEKLRQEAARLHDATP